MLCLYRCPVLCPRRPTGGSALRITATTSTMSTTTATATTTTLATRMASFSAPLLSVKVNLRLCRCAEIRMGWREGEHDRHESENKCHDEPRRTLFAWRRLMVNPSFHACWFYAPIVTIRQTCVAKNERNDSYHK